jgi:SAM-dependent methyltransferase
VDPDKEIGRFFDCCETPGQRKMNTRFSLRARRELVGAVKDLGVEGRTILDVGCGPGDLTRELVRLGASRADGIDLAPKTLDEARRRVDEEGMSGVITFTVGNGAKESLERHDVVVLEKVICCYPDWRELVDNTSEAASRSYGFVIPRSDWPIALIVRAFVALSALFLKIRKCGFRPFVHDFEKIDRHLHGRGLRRHHLSKGPIWVTAVYSRSA